MIQVIPSIAVRHGQVVKMRKGDINSEKAYDENPLDLAKRFEDHGIEVVHLVDLDGAERGSPKSYHILEAIAGHTDLKIDFTGGISSDGDMGRVLLDAADRYSKDPVVDAALRKAVESVHSDGVYRSVMSEIAGRDKTN